MGSRVKGHVCKCMLMCECEYYMSIKDMDTRKGTVCVRVRARAKSYC